MPTNDPPYGHTVTPQSYAQRLESRAKATSRTLTALAIEHKGRCDDPDCPISLSLLIPLIEAAEGRALTSDELGLFL